MRRIDYSLLHVRYYQRERSSSSKQLNVSRMSFNMTMSYLYKQTSLHLLLRVVVKNRREVLLLARRDLLSCACPEVVQQRCLRGQSNTWPS